MSTVQEKLAWLDAVRRKVQKFVDEGGDLKSEEAAQLGVTLYLAVNDLKTEFGTRASRSFNGSQDTFPPDPTWLLH